MGPLGVMALKFWTWMKLPDHSDTGDCTQKLTAGELPSIVKRLKARQLVPIGLVLTNSTEGKLWENHQILGYGVKECEHGVIELQIYDPNYPKDDKVVIRVTPVTKEAPADARSPPRKPHRKARRPRSPRRRSTPASGSPARAWSRRSAASSRCRTSPRHRPKDLGSRAWIVSLRRESRSRSTSANIRRAPSLGTAASQLHLVLTARLPAEGMNSLVQTVLVVILILLVIGMLPMWPYSSGWGWGYYPSGGLGLLLLVILVLALMGKKRI